MSVGGTIALEFAERYPERVQKLCLQGPVYRSTDLPQRFRFMYDLLGRTGLIEIVPKLPIKWWFIVRRLDMGRDTRQLSAEDRRQMGRDALRVPNETLIEVARQLLTLDMTDTARRICVPTLVLDGADARMVPAKASRHLSRLIPGARCHIVPDAAHNRAMEKPREFQDLLPPFLEGDAYPCMPLLRRARGRQACPPYSVRYNWLDPDKLHEGVICLLITRLPPWTTFECWTWPER